MGCKHSAATPPASSSGCSPTRSTRSDNPIVKPLSTRPQEICRASFKRISRKETVKQLMKKFGLQSAAEIRGGVKEKISLFPGEVSDTRDWNPIHFSIYKGHMDLVKYFFDSVGENERLSCRIDTIPPYEGETFPL